MAFTSIHPAGLPTPPPPPPLPAPSVFTADHMTSITYFLFSSSASIEDGTTDGGKAWRCFLDGLWVEENVHYVYWGLEDRMDTQDQERGEGVLLAVDRRLPAPMPSSRAFGTGVSFAPLLPYLLTAPHTTLAALKPFTPHLALGHYGGLTFCTIYHFPESLPPAITAEIPQLWSYEVMGLMPRDARARGIGWGVEGCAGGWVLGVGEEDKNETRRFMALIDWGLGDGKEAWEASVQGKRLGKLWDERAVGERDRWVAKMKVDREGLKKAKQN